MATYLVNSLDPQKHSLKMSKDILYLQGSSGLTPLHLASANGFTEVVEALLQEGASVNISEISELRYA